MGKLIIDRSHYSLLLPKDEAVLSRERELAKLEPDDIFIGIDYANRFFGDKCVKTKFRLLGDGKIEVVSIEKFDCAKDVDDTVIEFHKKKF